MLTSDCSLFTLILQFVPFLAHIYESLKIMLHFFDRMPPDILQNTNIHDQSLRSTLSIIPYSDICLFIPIQKALTLSQISRSHALQCLKAFRLLFALVLQSSQKSFQPQIHASITSPTPRSTRIFSGMFWKE